MLDTMTRITTHPGEVLREEFMKPLGLSASALARDLDVASAPARPNLHG
jgi:antitoxin HigA-1